MMFERVDGCRFREDREKENAEMVLILSTSLLDLNILFLQS